MKHAEFSSIFDYNSILAENSMEFQLPHCTFIIQMERRRQPSLIVLTEEYLEMVNLRANNGKFA